MKAVIAITNMMPGHQNRVANRTPIPINQIPPIKVLRRPGSGAMSDAPRYKNPRESQRDRPRLTKRFGKPL